MELVLQDQRRLRVIFKNLSPSALLSEARRVRPEFLYDSHREIQVYQRILSKAPLGTATLLAVHRDEQAHKFWLFLKRVNGRELYRVGDFALWKQAAGWLARFHLQHSGPATNANDVEPNSPTGSHLPTTGTTGYRRH